MPTQSLQIINRTAQRFGTIDYSRWQAVRGQFYSWVTYPSAGISELNFFGTVSGQAGVSLADTNMPKAGSFGQQHFLVKSISLGIKISNNDLSGFNTTNIATNDTRTLASDLLYGFAQAGVLNFSIGARPFATIVRPFLYAPPNNYEPEVAVAPFEDPSAAPVVAGSTVVTGEPIVRQTRNKGNVYICDPNLLIEAEQQFSVALAYPSGIIPVLATNVVNDTTNPLKVGVILDGLVLRPMQ
jgi:hypothetical protein